MKIKTYILGILVLVSLILCSGICGYIDNHYTRKAEIIKVENERVIVKDESNNIWSFYGTDYQEGETVILKMFTCFTDSIEDDEVIDVK